MLCKLLLVLAADVPGSNPESVVFISKSLTVTFGKTRACEPLTTKNTTQELIRNCDARLAMLCSPVWHECMRLNRRWWEVRGERPSYNFYDLVAAACSLQQVSILNGGEERGKGMLLIATRVVSVPLCIIYLNYELRACVDDGCIDKA